MAARDTTRPNHQRFCGVQIMKIVFDANPLVTSKSGVGYYTDRLIRALAKSDPELELVGYYFNFGGRKTITDLPEAKNIQYKELRFIPGKILNICRRLGFAFPLNLFIHQKADIVLSTNFVPTLTIPDAKQVVAVHDLSFIDHPDFVSGRNGTFLRKWVPKTLKKSAFVITISSFTKQRLIDVYNVSESKVHITPIPPAKHVQADSSAITKFGLGGGYMLFVGTIEPRKNILGLLEAYSLLYKKDHRILPLVLAGGKGWNDEETLARIAKLREDNLEIIQTGYVSDGEKAALYEHAMLCVQPSHYEGFGMPILEAMSYGKPVACSDLSVFHELANDAVIYFDKDNPASIADTLSKLANEPKTREHLAKLGKQLLNNYPSWEQVASDLVVKLKQL